MLASALKYVAHSKTYFSYCVNRLFKALEILCLFAWMTKQIIPLCNNAQLYYCFERQSENVCTWALHHQKTICIGLQCSKHQNLWEKGAIFWKRCSACEVLHIVGSCNTTLIFSLIFHLQITGFPSFVSIHNVMASHNCRRFFFIGYHGNWKERVFDICNVSEVESHECICWMKT